MHSLSQTYLQQRLGPIITPNSFPSWNCTSALRILSVKPRADYRHSQWNQPSVLRNIWLTLPDLSTITGWDSRALRHQFYQGLSSWIKDKISWIGKPDTLSQLRLMAQSIDGHYWEREEETRWERNTQHSEKKLEKSLNQQSSSNNSKKDFKKQQQKESVFKLGKLIK